MQERYLRELLVVAKEEPAVASHHGHDGRGHGHLTGFIDHGRVKVGGVEAVAKKGKWRCPDHIGTVAAIQPAFGEVGEYLEG